MDEELFDEDEALDYVLYEDVEEPGRDPHTSNGCLSSVLLILSVGTIFGLKILI